MRATPDPGPALFVVALLVCAVIGAALWLVHAATVELDEHVRQQVEQATCPTDAPVRPTRCEPRP